MEKTVVLIQTRATPFIENPQIAYITNDSWAVCGAYKKQSALFVFCGLPPLPAGVPIVNLEPVKHDPRVDRAIQKHSSPAGVDNVDTLVRLLEGYGAQTMYSV